MTLDRRAIVEAGLELLDHAGLDDFTTRRLAEKLGIRSPTLYWHFKSKRDLLDAMAHAMLADHHAGPLAPEDDDWRTAWFSNAQSFRRALLARRDGARVYAGTRPTEGQLPRAEAMMRLLDVAGFSPEEALSLSMALSRFVLGWVLEEQAAAARADRDGDRPPLSATRFPLLADAVARTEHVHRDTTFDLGLKLLLGSHRRS